MAKLGINTGSSPNDGTGDSLLQGAIKINSNFNEIYNAIGNGTTITNSIGFARTAGISTLSGYATTAGISTFAVTAGISSYSTISGLSTASSYAVTAGIATVALFAGNFSSVPDITVGVVTASSYNGSGVNLTGVITSILAGSNVSVARTGGTVTINSTAQSAVSTQWTTVASGIVTSSRVGIGTINPISALNLHSGVLSITGAGGGVQINDGLRINLGSSGAVDASIYYDSVDLRIDTSSSIRIGNGSNNVFSAVAGEGSLLYYNGSKKLQTLANGVSITGDLGVSGVTTANNIVSSGNITASTFSGSGSNLTGIVTSLVAGSNVSISTSFGRVRIDVNSDSSWVTTNAGVHTFAKVGLGTTNPTSTLSLFGNADFNGNILINNGVTISGVTTISSGRIQFAGTDNIRIGNLSMGSGSTRNISIGDQSLFTLSSGLGHNIAIGEFTLYDTTSGQYNVAIGDRAGKEITTGNYNVILGSYDGNNTSLDIRASSNNVVLSDGEGNIKLYANSSGNVGIKTTVVTEALTVAGVVSATSFYGTLNASQLTGVLPVLDGSNLINVIGSGSGVIIQDDATPVGTAGTINFGSNLSVSFASGIATVSGASSVSAATTAYNLAGSPNVTLGRVLAGVSTFNTGTLDVYNTSGTVFGAADVRIGGVGDFGFDGTNTFATHGSLTGELQVRSETAIKLKSAGFVGGVETYAEFVKNSGVSLYYDNVNKFETTGYGITVYGGVNAPAGIITASSFSGSASGLTNIPSGQLTGALPAIDGSALFGVIASGTGIEIKDNGTIVGAAGTIDFGLGLDVSPVSAGVVTVTSSGGSLQSRVVVTGVTTSIANNGIGNTNITGFKSYALMKVGLSTAGWLRLYTDSTSRQNDANRSVGTDPSPGSGVIAEVITTGISTTQIISPFVMGGNMDNPEDIIIYASIKNLSGTTQSITADLTILQLEA